MAHPLNDYYAEERPWGSFERLTSNEPSTVKILAVAAGKRFSLQRHAKREEYWRVIQGSGTLEIDGETRTIAVGDEALVKVGATHRLTGGPDGLRVLEVSFGEFDEGDIERIEDDYGRA
jgi:mannose-6-phosphate isomerase